MIVYLINKLYPADTWRRNDVGLTAMRRDHVASTSVRRHYDVTCPLGIEDKYSRLSISQSRKSSQTTDIKVKFLHRQK